MGLDMYLTAERFFGSFSDPAGRDRMLAAVGDDRPPMADDGGSATLSYDVGYWRKANAIHGWFVENVQGGVDECERHSVALHQLRDLLGLCQTLLADRDEEKAEELLPTQDGFFFGGTDYNDWYWDCLEQTVDQVGGLLDWFDAEPHRAAYWDVYYRSSW